MAEPIVRVEEFAPAKINLALHVLGRREDGYHELDSVVAFADVGDVLTLHRAEATTLSLAGPFAGTLEDVQGNLVLKAYEGFASVLAELGERAPPVAFHLRKNLPVASGIGGGSADAAAALRGLMRLTQAQIPADTLQSLALSLGADVPVCLAGKACRMRGIGEELSEHGAALPAAIVLVNPKVSTLTPQVFGKLGLARGQHYGSAVDPAHPQLWRNDLTNPAKALVPEIELTLNQLFHQPQLLAVRMSGSGATCFGLAPDLKAAQLAAGAIAAQCPGWWVEAARLL